MNELNFRANADVEDAREASRDRKRNDRRTDRERGTVVARTARKVVDATVPPGSKRRKAAYGTAATLLSAAAIYEGSRAVTFIGEKGAQVVRAGGEVAGDVLGEGEENPDAPYADGETSVGEVQAAQEREAAEKRLSDAAAEHESGSGN